MEGRSVRFEEGALVLDGDRRLLVAGDYPYYRDRPERWAEKLARMREAGIEVVTFYLPWRHHLVEEGDGSRRFVFSGGPGDNRDVLGFIQEVGKAGLLGLAKPGPFVHAEVQLGGLPDHFSPSHDARLEPAVSADGKPLRAQGLALPSAVTPRFLEACREWLGAVAEQVLAGRLYPSGPLLGVQLGNEGLYSDAALALDAFDYSESALRRFRSFLALRYRVIDALNVAYGTSLRSFGEVPPLKGWGGAPSLTAVLDWGEWCGHYLERVLREWSGALGECPKLVNLPPPARGRLDAWLGRVRPERLRGLEYGFTSWVGNALEEDGAFLSYLVAARRQRGPNLEENWGFSWSDARCVHPISPTYHALLALAAGATGLSVYPACATDAWGPSIEVEPRNVEPEQARSGMYARPYGGEAPITVTGGRGRKFETLSLLTRFLRHEGGELVD
ncbi:MAG TPA: beta-galactosidase, partial [Myxococcaceae bacterium]|nr:beta-galactosidase [Myxococcaceae bacterium]